MTVIETSHDIIVVSRRIVIVHSSSRSIIRIYVAYICLIDLVTYLTYRASYDGHLLSNLPCSANHDALERKKNCCVFLNILRYVVACQGRKSR